MPEDNQRNSTPGPPPFLRIDEEYLAWGESHPDLVYAALPGSVRSAFDAIRPGGPAGERPQGPPPEPDDTVRDILAGMSQSWDDIRPYFVESKPAPFQPVPGLWEELLAYVGGKWADVRLGFTELPRQMIFRGRFTLFRYALVVLQEMKKDRIDRAPGPEAQDEVRRVYASLGFVVNDVARWLRRHGVRCQSNHPMGGLVNTPSLAAKAGLGWQGRSGILVTPEFGPRVRLAPVFIEHQFFDFTDNRDHDWIEQHCETCRKCEEECPGQAIHSQKVVSVENVPGVGALRTCIDLARCLGPFSRTMGCAVCVKVCPFSQGDDSYSRLKAVVESQSG